MRALVLLAVVALAAPLGASSSGRSLHADKVFPVPLVGGPCATGAPSGSVAYAEGFEGGAGGWTKVSQGSRPNLWHWTGTFLGNNSAMDAWGHGGPGRLYYGIENRFGGTYNTDPIPNTGEMRSPALVVPAGTVAFELNTKWEVELDRPTVVDAMMLGYVDASGARTLLCYLGNSIGQVSPLVLGYGYYGNSPLGQAVISGCKYDHESVQQPCGALARNVLHENLDFDLANATNLWEPRYVTLPASLAGQTIRLTAWFTTGDAIVDDASGWMVDDVSVVRIA